MKNVMGFLVTIIVSLMIGILMGKVCDAPFDHVPDNDENGDN